MSGRPPRVAFFTDSFHEVNGVALTSRQFEACARRHSIPMFSCHAGPETRSWREGTVTTYEWKRSSFAIGLEADLSFDLRFWRHRAPIRQALRQFRPDVVHVTSPGDCSLLGLLLARDLRIPVAASWHTNVHEFGARRLERVLSRVPTRLRHAMGASVEDRLLSISLLLYSAAKVTFAPNPELVELLEARLGVPCGLMSRGIDSTLFDPARRKRRDGIFRIGYVGRLSAEKNLEEFITLEQSLLSNGRTDFEMVLVGHGSMAETLERRLTHRRLPGVLKGELLAAEYANFDLFIFPSKTDTFGNVVLEALASGVPAIVTGEGGPKFLVREGETGHVVRSGKELTDCTCRLMTDRPALARMSEAARAYALSHHDWDSVFASVYRHYEQLGSEACSGARSMDPLTG